MATMRTSHLVRLLDGWASGHDPLHTDLADRLRHLVHSGSLPAGARVPSERTLGAALNVSRNTVGAAFDELRADGVFTSRRGDGTYVTFARRYAAARGDARLRTFTSPVTPPEQIDLRSAALPGLPMVTDALEQLDTSDFRGLVGTHGYVPAGLATLRQAVADYYGALGLPTTLEQVLITSGAQQALRLFAESTLERGAPVLIEEPCFRGAIEVFRSVGAQLIPVPSGLGGVNLPALRAAVVRHKPALVVVQSTVGNPTGAVIDHAARRAIADLGVPVLDDAAPADALIDGPMPRPLPAFGGDIVTIGSASKAFWGGLRVGWLRADPGTVAALATNKSGQDLGTSVLAQLLTVKLLSRVDLAREQRRAALHTARSSVIRILGELLPQWTPQPPLGGASLWIQLPTPGATAFTQRAERAGVSVLPGPTFSCTDGLDNYLRVAYAGPLDDVLVGVARLATAWQRFARSPSATANGA